MIHLALVILNALSWVFFLLYVIAFAIPCLLVTVVGGRLTYRFRPFGVTIQLHRGRALSLGRQH